MPKDRDLLEEIIKELLKDQNRINSIRHGKVVIYIQDGRLVRIETTEGRQIA